MKNKLIIAVPMFALVIGGVMLSAQADQLAPGFVTYDWAEKPGDVAVCNGSESFPKRVGEIRHSGNSASYYVANSGQTMQVQGSVACAVREGADTWTWRGNNDDSWTSRTKSQNPPEIFCPSSQPVFAKVSCRVADPG